MGGSFQTNCRLEDGASRGESSKRGSLLGKGEKREKGRRGTKRDVWWLYRDSLGEEPEEVAYTTIEMQPMAPYEGDEERKPRGKGKKKAEKGKADKGKAVDRDPGFIQCRGSLEVEKRRAVEPGKFFSLEHCFKKRFEYWKQGFGANLKKNWIEEDQGEPLELLDALARLRLDCDDEEDEEGQVQVQGPCHEVEDGWMVIEDDIDVWDFTDEVGDLPD